jgi:hypothetical protein
MRNIEARVVLIFLSGLAFACGQHAGAISDTHQAATGGGGTGGGSGSGGGPTQPACNGLDEQQCLATQGCEPIYIESGSACGCPACAPGATCPPCDCPPPPPPTRQFAGCKAVDPCEHLDENQCRATPGCEVIYSPCPAIACPVSADGGVPPGCECNPQVTGCRSVNPPPPPPPSCDGLDEWQCRANTDCAPIYGTVCAADTTCNGCWSVYQSCSTLTHSPCGPSPQPAPPPPAPPPGR